MEDALGRDGDYDRNNGCQEDISDAHRAYFARRATATERCGTRDDGYGNQRHYQHLDKLDKELEQRGLRFTRYADDVLIFTKSEMAANRVMKSICSWLERKLFLKVNATKTKVVRPTRSKYLGFTFLKDGLEWKVRPTNEKKKKLKKAKQALLNKMFV